MVAASPLRGSSVVFFDGICVLCNRSVAFVRRHDLRGVFKFATLQGPEALACFARRGIDVRDLAAIFVITELGTPRERVYRASSAVLAIARRLRWPWRLASYVMILVPRPLRDWFYGQIARRRYRWFGQYEACPIPSPPDRATLVDDAALAGL